MARQTLRKLAGEVTPAARIDAANDAANKILEELRAAQTLEECAAIGERTAKVFARLQEVHPVRAIHIVNLAQVKKRELEMRKERENQAQADLFA